MSLQGEEICASVPAELAAGFFHCACENRALLNGAILCRRIWCNRVQRCNCIAFDCLCESVEISASNC